MHIITPDTSDAYILEQAAVLLVEGFRANNPLA